MLCIIGKSASGKDLIKNKLINEYGYNNLVTYTTRPIRPGEKQDYTYHFISQRDFEKKIKDGFFAEWRAYTSAQGVWLYGSAKEDYINSNDKTVIILSPSSVRDILNCGINNLHVIYVYSNIDTIRKRLKQRGDDKEEAERRIRADIDDFKNAEFLSHKIVYNNYDDNIEEVIEKIIELSTERTLKCGSSQ